MRSTALRRPVRARTPDHLVPCDVVLGRRHTDRPRQLEEIRVDDQAAELIRRTAAGLTGISRLERRVAVPPALRSEYSDERWLAFRLRSTQGLACHQVLAALRSSRAALVEHLLGNVAVVDTYRLDPKVKSSVTGDVIGRLAQLPPTGRPR
jgi:hypothetical protein